MVNFEVYGPWAPVVEFYEQHGEDALIDAVMDGAFLEIEFTEGIPNRTESRLKLIQVITAWIEGYVNKLETTDH